MSINQQLLAALETYPPSEPIQVEQSIQQNEERKLDLVFILDCTGSMGSYIASATKNCQVIVENILQSERLSNPESLRIGLIAYRDHPPQDNTYLVKDFGFTSNVSYLRESLESLSASGGGDGPEAVGAAMKAALEMEWRPDATKMAVIISDAPPHGIGEYGDGFPEGGPDRADPLKIARQMASLGIPLFVVACEPALSGYMYATDFFRAVANITSAVMIPLTNAALLSHVIVGWALEQMDMDRIINEVGLAVAERVHGGDDIDLIAKALHEKLLLRNESTKSLFVESIHNDSEEARHNVEVFTQSPSVVEAKPHLKRMVGSRFTEKYLSSRYERRSALSPVTFPLKSPTRHSATRHSPYARSPPSSPPRRPITDYKPFTGSPGYNMTFQEAPLAQELKPRSIEEELAQSIELRFGQISLDQARRITVASAWRSAPPRI